MQPAALFGGERKQDRKRIRWRNSALDGFLVFGNHSAFKRFGGVFIKIGVHRGPHLLSSRCGEHRDAISVVGADADPQCPLAPV